MPAHVGFFAKLKITALSSVQFTPTKLGKSVSCMGYVMLANIYKTMEIDRDRWNHFRGGYQGFRYRLNTCDPTEEKRTSVNNASSHSYWPGSRASSAARPRNLWPLRPPCDHGPDCRVTMAASMHGAWPEPTPSGAYSVGRTSSTSKHSIWSPGRMSS